jgi:hypothetical protein
MSTTRLLLLLVLALLAVGGAHAQDDDEPNEKKSVNRWFDSFGTLKKVSNFYKHHWKRAGEMSCKLKGCQQLCLDGVVEGDQIGACTCLPGT